MKKFQTINQHQIYGSYEFFIFNQQYVCEQIYHQLKHIIQMYKVKDERARRLEIKVPNLCFSQQKIKSGASSSKQVNSKSSQQHQKSRILSNNSSNSPKNIKNPVKMMKIKMNSKSPKEKQSLGNISKFFQLSRQRIQSNIDTSRNINDLKQKLAGNRLPLKLSTKFFKKQRVIAQKVDNMKKNWKQLKAKNSKPNYELKMIRKLGKSQTGQIILAVSNVNGLIVAIKTFQKSKIKLQFLIDEMKIHLYCQHPNILPAYGVHVGREEVYLMMEFGHHNLYEEILKQGPFNEAKTAQYIEQIIKGIDYLHKNGIMHRDLKPENIICVGKNLKITDFGWSIKTSAQRKTLCGTLDYISPEVANKELYNNKIDCWSVGVLMYEMLTVQPPFAQQGKDYNFSTLMIPEYLSNQCKNLMKKFLQIDPQKRISAQEALNDPWLKKFKVSHILQENKKWKQLHEQIQKLMLRE